MPGLIVHHHHHQMLSAQQIDPHRHPHLLISSANSAGLHVASPPSHPASHERGSPAPSTGGADHMDHKSDFTCPLRFGDITIAPKSGTTHGLTHGSLLLAGSSCSSSSKLSSAPAESPQFAATINIDSGPQAPSMSSMPAEPRSLLTGKEDDCRQDLTLEEAAMKANPVPVPITVAASSPRSGFPGSWSSGSMVGSPVLPDAFLALQKFLPSNSIDCEEVELWPALDAYSCDEFRMYEFKVRKCVRGRSHDWTECPFAHPGEKARRRDPRRYHYSGTACPDFRKGSCRKGEACEYAHGVFECWLHPARYRTQPCKDGRNCQRRVCFFAHTPDQLRVALSTAGNSGDSSPASGTSARSNLLKAAAMSGGSYDGSPLRRALAASLDASVALELLLEENSSTMGAGHHHNHSHHSLCQAYAASSPTSTLVGHSVCPSPLTPDPSPCSSPPLSPNSLPNTTTLWSSVPPHRRHLDRLRSVPTITVPSYEEVPCIAMSPPAATDSQSPRTMAELLSALQHLQIKSFNSREAAAVGQLGPQVPLWATGLPSQQPQIRSAPVTPKSRYASQQVMGVQQAAAEPLSAPLESRVESGRDLRVKIYAKLSQEMNAPGVSTGAENETPDFGWVNELVQ